MNRPIFLRQPWWVRLSRAYRLHRSQSMAQPNQRQQPLDRPLNVHRVWFVVCVIVAAVFLWLGEGIAYRKQQATSGIYNPTPPIQQRLDCSTEGLTACRAQKRMSAVRKEM